MTAAFLSEQAIAPYRQQLADYRQQLQAARYRGLVVISGEPDWCRGLAMAVQQRDAEALWVGADGGQALEWIPARRCLGMLGQERSDVVFDAWQGLDPDALGAISGTIKAGHLLFLLTPAFKHWAELDDPEDRRILVEPYGRGDVGRRFLQHVMRSIESAEASLHWRQAEDLTANRAYSFPAPATETPSPPCRSADQAAAVEAVLKVVHGHRRRPLVLSADRGRGKSSALGIAAARLLAEGVSPLIVTGPSFVQTEQLFVRIRELLPDARQHGTTLVHGKGRIDYLAPDVVAGEHPPSQLLLVDEAAAIPVPLLEGMAQHYSRLVFATTVHGYEGTGRGFEIRFKASLAQHCDRWHELHLQQPIRWAEGDPLERVIFELLLLNAEAELSEFSADLSELEIAKLDRDRLVANPQCLRHWFGLLVNAHYRTRPYDLRQMLDGPNIHIWTATLHGQLLGSVIVAQEGLSLDDEMQEAIYRGTRRLHGHLLPQSLLVHSGYRQAFDYRYARIVRIAVAPQWQAKGIGTLLLAAISRWAASEADFLAVSFGLNDRLIRFWRSHQLQPVRIGFKQEASSGEHNIMLLRPLNSVAEAQLKVLLEGFARELSHQLAEPLRDVDARHIALLQGHYLQLPMQQSRLQVVVDFAQGYRGYDSALGALSEFLSWRLFTALATDKPQELEALSLLIAKLWQKTDVAELGKRYGVTGRPRMMALLQGAVNTLLDQAGEPSR